MKTQSFPKKRRILSSSDFKSILDGGEKIRSSSFTIFAKTPSVFEKGRLGISVNKRVGQANVRNRIRRIIREAFRKSPEVYKKDWVFLVSPGATVKSNPELFQELERIIHKLINRT